jgi:transcriptional regulator with XRE-family HTH domain
MDIRGVARNLRRVRHKKGYSQEALTLEAAIDRTYISALDRGVYSSSIYMVDRLAVVLGVETDTLPRRYKSRSEEPLPSGADPC